MIDLKAIRAAAEKAEKHFYNERRQSDFRSITDRKTVIALLDRLEAAEKDAARLEHKVSHLEQVIAAMKDEQK